MNELQVVLNGPVSNEIENKKQVHNNKESKLSRAVEIYRNNMNLTRKELMKMFMEQLNMTEAGASTYYVIARKRLGISKPKQ